MFEPKRQDPRRKDGPYADLGRYAGLGLTFAITLVVFAYGGMWLDEHLGTEPWLLIAGVFAGAVGGTISLIRKVPPATGGRRSAADAADEARRDRGGGDGPVGP